jgi:hypothetical protein
MEQTIASTQRLKPRTAKDDPGLILLPWQRIEQRTPAIPNDTASSNHHSPKSNGQFQPRCGTQRGNFGCNLLLCLRIR